MDYHRLLIVDYSQDQTVMYVDVANDAKKMGAEHSQVLFPPGPV